MSGKPKPLSLGLAHFLSITIHNRLIYQITRIFESDSCLTTKKRIEKESNINIRAVLVLFHKLLESLAGLDATVSK